MTKSTESHISEAFENGKLETPPNQAKMTWGELEQVIAKMSPAQKAATIKIMIPDSRLLPGTETNSLVGVAVSQSSTQTSILTSRPAHPPG